MEIHDVGAYHRTRLGTSISPVCPVCPAAGVVDNLSVATHLYFSSKIKVHLSFLTGLVFDGLCDGPSSEG